MHFLLGALYHWPVRIMGLDVGDRSIGVAISDAMQITAQGRPTLRRSTAAKDIEHLRRLVEENEVTEIVVGLPLHMSGDESRQSEKISRFAEELGQALNVTVNLRDERLSTVAAERHLRELGMNWRKRRQHVDEIAAILILQSYLDSRR